MSHQNILPPWTKTRPPWEGKGKARKRRNEHPSVAILHMIPHGCTFSLTMQGGPTIESGQVERPGQLTTIARPSSILVGPWDFGVLELGLSSHNFSTFDVNVQYSIFNVEPAITIHALQCDAGAAFPVLDFSPASGEDVTQLRAFGFSVNPIEGAYYPLNPTPPMAYPGGQRMTHAPCVYRETIGQGSDPRPAADSAWQTT
jgi:hypothetical protein